MVEKFNFSYGGKEYHAAYINDFQKFDKAVRLLEANYPVDSGDILGLDIETAPLPAFRDVDKAALIPALAQICTVQIYASTNNTVFIFHVNNFQTTWANRLREFLETRKFIAHNAVFETSHLLHNGIVMRGNLNCSMLLYRILLHAVSHTASSMPTGLKALAEQATGEALPKDEQFGDWSKDKLTKAQKEYAAKDAVCTWLGGEWVISKIKENGLDSLINCYRLNRDVQLPIARMALAGFPIDKAKHTELILAWEAEIEIAKKKLYKILPEGLNLNSSKQVSNWIISQLEVDDEGKAILQEWERSEKTAHLKCDHETLLNYKHLPMVSPLLEYKKLGKLLSTYGRTLQHFFNPVTERLHTNYSLCYTATGRLSAFEPNIQQIPRGDCRAIFTSDEGWKLVGADFNAMESRVVAYVSGDDTMIEAYSNGEDLYITVAALILEKSPSEITKEERQLSKAILLGSYFGLGAKKMRRYLKTNYGIDVSDEKASGYLFGLRKKLPLMRQWQIQTTKNAEVSLQAVTRMGKIRELNPEKYYGQALNTPIQGSAAEVMLCSLVNIELSLSKNKLKTELLGSIHDEIVLHSPSDEVEIAARLLQKAMEDGMMEVFPEASLHGLVEVKTGKNWGELK